MKTVAIITGQVGVLHKREVDETRREFLRVGMDCVFVRYRDPGPSTHPTVQIVQVECESSNSVIQQVHESSSEVA